VIVRSGNGHLKPARAWPIGPNRAARLQAAKSSLKPFVARPVPRRHRRANPGERRRVVAFEIGHQVQVRRHANKLLAFISLQSLKYPLPAVHRTIEFQQGNRFCSDIGSASGDAADAKGVLCDREQMSSLFVHATCMPARGGRTRAVVCQSQIWSGGVALQIPNPVKGRKLIWSIAVC